MPDTKVFFGGKIRFLGGNFPPLRMPRINTDYSHIENIAIGRTAVKLHPYKAGLNYEVVKLR